MKGYGIKTSGKGGNKAPFKGASKINAKDGGTKSGPSGQDALHANEVGTGRGS